MTILTAPAPQAGHAAPEPYRRRVLLAGLVARTWLWFIGGCLVVTLLPIVLGWRPYVVESGSMLPRLAVGDVVIAAPDRDPKDLLGRITVFNDPDVPGKIKVHRVTEIKDNGTLTTKGDNNPTADPSAITADDVRGLGRLLVRFVGLPLVWVQTGQWIWLFLLLLSLLLAARAVTRDQEPGDDDPDDDGPAGQVIALPTRMGGATATAIAAAGSLDPSLRRHARAPRRSGAHRSTPAWLVRARVAASTVQVGVTTPLRRSAAMASSEQRSGHARAPQGPLPTTGAALVALALRAEAALRRSLEIAPRGEGRRAHAAPLPARREAVAPALVTAAQRVDDAVRRNLELTPRRPRPGRHVDPVPAWLRETVTRIAEEPGRLGDAVRRIGRTPRRVRRTSYVAVLITAILAPTAGAAFAATTRNPADSWAAGSWTYTSTITGMSPWLYWKLDETAGTTAADTSGNGRTGTYNPNAAAFTYGVAGANTSATTNLGVTLNGTTACINTTSTTTMNAPVSLTEIVWFKTATTQGGKLIGFEMPRTGVAMPGSGGTYDRHLYMDGNGRVWYGVYNNGYYTIGSTASYNNNQWHMAAASLGPSGMRLYLDGALVGTNANTVGETTTGWFRAGCGNLGGWGGSWTGNNNPTTNTNPTQNRQFAGSLDEIAIWQSELTPATIAQFYAAR